MSIWLHYYFLKYVIVWNGVDGNPDFKLHHNLERYVFDLTLEPLAQEETEGKGQTYLNTVHLETI